MNIPIHEILRQTLAEAGIDLEQYRRKPEELKAVIAKILAEMKAKEATKGIQDDHSQK